MVRTAAASTRQEALYLDIRARPIRGEFSPGEPIRTDELCARYEASVSLVREVLTRLAAQRLVTSEASKGFRVTPISAEQITDLCLVRSELEALTIRLAIERGDIEWRPPSWPRATAWPTHLVLPSRTTPRPTSTGRGRTRSFILCWPPGAVHRDCARSGRSSTTRLRSSASTRQTLWERGRRRRAAAHSNRRCNCAA